MKKKIGLFAVCALLLTACEQKTDLVTFVADFENLLMPEIGYWNGSDLTGELRQEEEWGAVVNNYYAKFSSSIFTFENVYTSDWASFKGAAYSAMTDTVTEGYLNQYSAVAGQGALGSKQYALLFDDGTGFAVGFTVNYEAGAIAQTLKSVLVCNGTYPYLEMRDGGFGDKFAEGDWFKVTFLGYKGDTKTGEVDYYLADFREGKSFLNKNWDYVDLTALSDADRVEVKFDGSDKGDYGLNTPRYVFIDNLTVEQEVQR